VRPNTARPNNGSLPRGKDKLIPRLKLLISQVTNDKDLQNFLISMYDETANDKYTVELFGGKTEEEAKQKIGVHVDLFSKELYRGSTPQMSFNIKGDDMINLAYLMYLDMIHDTTIPKPTPDGKKGMSFETFCGETITVSVKVPAPTNSNKKKTKMVKKNQKSPVYLLFGKGIKAKETKFIKTINAFIVNEKGTAEIAVKNNLPSIYPSILQKEVTIRKDQVTPTILTPGHNMFLSIDQEDEKATVTLDIQETKYKVEGGGTAKIMYPLVSVANLMDPGKNMLIESAKEDSKYFMLGLNNRDIRSRLTWNYKEPEFTINHDNGSTTIGAYYTDAARVTNKNRKTKRGYAYIIKNKNGKYGFSSNVSKAKAKDGSTGDKVAKFLGDFLQALTVVSYVKNNKNPKYHYCLATGDAMLANNFIFLCSRSGVSPNLWMATSTQQVSKVYGKMIDNIRTVQPAPTQVRNAPNVSNGNQVVSSGMSVRTEGSGESSGNRRNKNGTRSVAGTFGRRGGTPIQITNSNNNMNNNNRRTRTPNSKANNTQSVAGSIQGSVSINNNKNNVNQNPNKKANKNARNANNNVNAKLAAMLMTQTTSRKPNNASKSNKNLAQALANSKRLTNKWQSLKKNVLARRNKIRNNFRTVVNAAVKQNKNKKEVEKKARENAENEMSRLRAELEEAKKTALNAQKEVENQRRKTIKRKRVDTLLNINNSRKTRSRS
tara:strand:+ start:24 stop:2174 length:2151 start_codon:yes stop_codon:yes gene_type:complete